MSESRRPDGHTDWCQLVGHGECCGETAECNCKCFLKIRRVQYTWLAWCTCGWVHGGMRSWPVALHRSRKHWINRNAAGEA